MECEVCFSCEEHKASFSKLTTRQREFIAAYMKTGSPSSVAVELGLKGSPKGVSKRLAQIAKLMGCRSLRDLNPNKPLAKAEKATADELKRMVEKQEYRCALSGVKLTPDTAQLDHIVPLSEGGTNLIDNLQWLDARVNKAKGTMSQSEFVQMCKLVAQWSS